MSRIVLTDEDLSGQTINGQPFSYIGRCRGEDITFTGDWTHVSHFKNTFTRPDWSKAETRWSYSRFNTFTDAVTSEDMNTDDHDMLLAALDEATLTLTGTGQTAMAKVGDLLRADIEKGLYLISWAQVAPVFLAEFGNDLRAALEAATIAARGRPQLLKRVSGAAKTVDGNPCWSESEPPILSTEGIRTNAWGIVARNFDGKKRYSKHWSELPTPINPHDRLEMAELIEAEVEKAIGHSVTLYIVSIHSWGAYATWGRRPRDWPMRGSG